MTLSPRQLPDGGGRQLSTDIVATLDRVTVREVDAGVWALRAPSGDGGSCCGDIIFVRELGSRRGLVLPPQRFRVEDDTPMRLNAMGVAQMPYRSLDDWIVDIGASSEIATDGGAGVADAGLIVFTQTMGETREVRGGDGGLNEPPVTYWLRVELER